MRVTRKVSWEVERTVDIICNCCGDSCVPPAARAPTGRGTPVKYVKDKGLVAITEDESLLLRGPNAYGLIEATVTGGYDSGALSDYTQYTFSLCETCLKRLFDSFKLPPETGELDP